VLRSVKCVLVGARPPLCEDAISFVDIVGGAWSNAVLRLSRERGLGIQNGNRNEDTRFDDGSGS